MIVRDTVKVNVVRNLDEYPYMHKHLMNPSWKQICDAQRGSDVVTIVGGCRKFTVVSNKIDDCIHFYDPSSVGYKGFHLFYDDVEDVEYGEKYFNISFT